MTPKEAYEARKAARLEKRLDSNAEAVELLDVLDRFATAVERIADTMGRQRGE